MILFLFLLPTLDWHLLSPQPLGPVQLFFFFINTISLPSSPFTPAKFGMWQGWDPGRWLSAFYFISTCLFARREVGKRGSLTVIYGWCRQHVPNSPSWDPPSFNLLSLSAFSLSTLQYISTAFFVAWPPSASLKGFPDASQATKDLRANIIYTMYTGRHAEQQPPFQILPCFLSSHRFPTI